MIWFDSSIPATVLRLFPIIYTRIFVLCFLVVITVYTIQLLLDGRDLSTMFLGVISLPPKQSYAPIAFLGKLNDIGKFGWYPTSPNDK